MVPKASVEQARSVDVGLDLFEPNDDILGEIEARALKYGYWLSEYTPFTSEQCDCITEQ